MYKRKFNKNPPLRIDSYWRKESQARNVARKQRAKGWETRVTSRKDNPPDKRWLVWVRV